MDFLNSPPKSARFAAGVLTAMLMTHDAAAQGSPTVLAPPEARLPISEEVDKLFATMDNASSAGCALGIVQNGKLVYERGYGMADLDHGVPISSKTVFYIASTSKQFTAAAVQLLADEGKLSLDDDVRKYIEELPVYDKPITLRHLLHHTSGLRDYLTLMGLAATRFEDVHTETEVLDLIARQRALNFQPGEDYVYSNTGYFLLGVVVKRVTNQTLREFAEERLFRPLGMTSTHFHDNRTMIVKDRAIGYSPVGRGFELHHLANFEGVGDGGVMTTVEDLFRWDQALYDDKLGAGFGKRILRRGVLNNGDSLTYAGGLSLSNYRGLSTISHGGGFVGFRSEVLRFPDQKFTVICLCNNGAATPNRIAREVADIYLQTGLRTEGQTTDVVAEPKNKFVTVPLDTLRARVGAYRNPETGALWRLAERNGSLYATVSGTTFMLGALNPTRFRSVFEPPRVEFRFDRPKKKDEVMQVRVIQEGLPDERLEPVQLRAPSAEQLAEYVGDYESDELNVTYTISLWDDRLVARTREDVRTLSPLMQDRFAADIWEVVFARDASGAVAGFVMDAGRVWNIHFEKRVTPAELEPSGVPPATESPVPSAIPS